MNENKEGKLLTYQDTKKLRKRSDSLDITLVTRFNFMSLLQTTEKLFEIVKDLEWSGYTSNEWEIEYQNLCPHCYNDIQKGHKKDCELGLLLKEVKK
jgi:hypothetical protein